MAHNPFFEATAAAPPAIKAAKPNSATLSPFLYSLYLSPELNLKVESELLSSIIERFMDKHLYSSIFERYNQQYE